MQKRLWFFCQVLDFASTAIGCFIPVFLMSDEIVKMLLKNRGKEKNKHNLNSINKMKLASDNNHDESRRKTIISEWKKASKQKRLAG